MLVRFYDHQLNPINLPELAFQRAWLFGDGHFTTVKVVDGQCQLLNGHIERLRVAQCRLKMPELDWVGLQSVMEHLVKEVSFGVLKVLVSRGYSERGYGNLESCKPMIAIYTDSLAKPINNNPISLLRCQTRLGINSLLAGLKHLNRLEQVMIANELAILANSSSAVDGIVCNENEEVIETAKANLFYAVEGQWFTPDLSESGIAGVVRDAVLQSNPSISVTKRHYNDWLECVDAIVVTNSIIGMQAVEKVDLKPLNIDIALQFIDQNKSIWFRQ